MLIQLSFNLHLNPEEAQPQTHSFIMRIPSKGEKAQSQSTKIHYQTYPFPDDSKS